MLVVRASTSVTASKIDSAAKRASPPATCDCSGAKCFTVPFTYSVLTAPSLSTPPAAVVARVTRSDPDCPIVAQAATSSEITMKSAVRFMRPPVRR